jgi:uncharacterized protein HemX
MDSNNTSPTPASAIPPAPETPISAPSMPPPPPPASAPASVTQAGEGSGSKKKMMMTIIIVLIVAILAAGGFYYYQMMSGNTETPENTDQTTSGGEDLEKLNTEVKEIQVTDPEGSLAEIDEQITSLDSTASAKPASGSSTLMTR